MESSALLTAETRVIDLGAPDAGVGRSLAAQGTERYLGLVDPTVISRARRDAGRLAARLHPSPPDVVDRCNTDLLIVRSSHVHVLWTLRSISHISHVAVERGPRDGIERRLATLVGRVGGRLAPAGRQVWDGREFDVYRLPASSEPQARTYYSPSWGADGLAARLKESGMRYAVLRWFEDLPTIEPGEDLDVLVADEDVARFRELVEAEPGTCPLDLYSVSGLPASDYEDLAYYPPRIATQILDHAVVHQSGFSVPAPLDHLHSLAYHAVYHKGPRSGLPSETFDTPVPDPEHDYPSALERLAATHGVDLPRTVEQIDRYLASLGWRPPQDTLRRLSGSNPWAASLLATETHVIEGAQPAVFLVREAAMTVLGGSDVLRVLDHYGFDVLHDEHLAEDARVRAAQDLRGGNWGPGPFPRSGGRPALVVVALHYAPSQPYAWLAERYPHLSNAEIYEAKASLRRLVEDKVPATERFNPVHSSDDAAEAWEYVETILPEHAQALREEASRRSAEHTVAHVVRPLSRGRRARVDVVDGPSGPVVRKTFVPAFRRFMDRELHAMTELSDIVAAIPRPVDTGPFSFTVNYFEDDLQLGGAARLLPLPTIRAMVAVLRQVYDAGFDVVDAKPQNFLHDPVQGLKLIDLEFLHDYGETRPPFAQSANFVGPWPGFEGDLPVGDLSYESRWLPWTGLPVDVLVNGSLLEQRASRARYVLRRLTVERGSPPRRLLARGRSVARHARWLAGRRFTSWASDRARSGGIAQRRGHRA